MTIKQKNNDLDIWYSDQIKQIIRSANRARTILAILILCIILFPILLLSMLSNTDDLLFVALLIQTLINVGVVIYITRRIYISRLDLSKGSFVSWECLAATNFGTIMYNVSRKMNIDLQIMHFWIPNLSYLSSPFPSITVIGRDIYFIIPAPALTFAREQSNVIEAVLAHEFAHVHHNDVTLWPLTQDIVKGLYMYFAVCTIIGFLTVVIFAAIEFGMPWNWPIRDLSKQMPIAAFMGVKYCEHVLSVRRRSEIMADILAARTVGHKSIIAALSNLVDNPRDIGVILYHDSGYPTDNAEFDIHPHKSLRLWYINHFFCRQ